MPKQQALSKYTVAEWGLSYNHGWRGLIAAAQELAVRFGAEVHTKEKLGGLVVEWSETNADNRGFLSRMGLIIEVASRNTCQVCGQNYDVKLYGVCWSLCRDCRKLVNTTEGPKQRQLIDALRARAGV